MKTKISAFLLAAVLFIGLPLASSSAFVAVSVGIAPPPIPVYAQPPCPVEGYIWTPGYWAYGGGGYYWVPGVWVTPPQVGFLWTPGYWGFRGGNYAFINGYWGPTVGFYGGVNYGFGYGGVGYVGGQWAGGVFRYNTAVTRVNTTVIHNTYINKEVVNNGSGTRASFNGPGGTTVKPTPQQQAAAKAPHVPATPAQRSIVQAAQSDPSLRAKNNGGSPKPEAVNSFVSKHAPAAKASTAPAVTANKAPTKNAPAAKAPAAKGTTSTAAASKASKTSTQQASETKPKNKSVKPTQPPHPVNSLAGAPQHRPPVSQGHGAKRPAGKKKKEESKPEQ